MVPSSGVLYSVLPCRFNQVNNTALSLLVIFGLIGGSYVYHINALADATTEAKAERDELWKGRLAKAKADHRETANAIALSYVNARDDDVASEFERVFPNASKGNNCDCSGKLSTDPRYGSGYDTIERDADSVVATPQEDTELSYEGEITYEELTAQTCSAFPTIDERKACFMLLN